MAIITEIEVAGTVFPTDGQPTHSSDYGEGGWRSVATYSDLAPLLANNPMRIIEGTAVFVRDVEALYTFKNSAWVLTTLFADVDFSSVAIGDMLMYTVNGWELGGGSAGIPPRSIKGSQIKYATITDDNMAPDSIYSTNIVTGAIQYINLGKPAVSGDNIYDGCISESKLDTVYVDSIATNDYVSGNFVQFGGNYTQKIVYSNTVGPATEDYTDIFGNTTTYYIIPSGDGYPGDPGDIVADNEYLYVCLSGEIGDPVVPTRWERVAWDTGTNPWFQPIV